MVRIGIVGIGFMGMIHYLAAQKLKGARVAAICSRDPKKLAGDWRSIRGNFGPPGTWMDLGKVKKYDELEHMFADPEIDLVDVCNPTHLHPSTARAALRAGKHVLVEKAIALTTRDADAMLKEAERAGRMLMVAHVLPFVPEFAFAAEVIRSGKYGKLVGAHFIRVISRPDWSAEIGDASKTGGPAVDLHIHDTHFIGLVCGVPQRVYSSGIMEGGAVQYLTTLYHYPHGGPCVSCSSGAVAQKGRMFIHGYEIYLENAMLIFDGSKLTMYQGDKAKQPKLRGGGDPTGAFTLELQTAVNAVATGKEPDLLSGQLARDALVMCHKEIESVRGGRPVVI
jgi:predicted dehydrogenase